MAGWINALPQEEAERYFNGIAADLYARQLIIELAQAIYEGPGDTPLNEAVATLWHADYYLEDRIGYEMNPAPKNMVLLSVRA